MHFGNSLPTHIIQNNTFIVLIDVHILPTVSFTNMHVGSNSSFSSKNKNKIIACISTSKTREDLRTITIYYSVIKSQFSGFVK
jgi:hypothetical protein